jgi:hypothetical protein
MLTLNHMDNVAMKNQYGLLGVKINVLFANSWVLDFQVTHKS